MIVKPMIRSNICLNAHPAGCKANVQQQISITKAKKETFPKTNRQIKNVLVLGCSNGYGLASRITATFGYGAGTIGVSFEKEGTETKGGTAGWYNNLAFDAEAKKTGIYSQTIIGDAFSDEIKAQVINEAKKQNIQFDLIVYSLASPLRVDPDTGVMYKSVLKPFGKPFSGKTLDPFTGELKEIIAEPATDEEASATVKVMGGEDWKRWINQLGKSDVLAKNCITLAYSYIGPESTQALYRKGTIGKAKEHLEQTALELNKEMATFSGQAFVSVNKGLVTRASAVIPVIPLYLATLFKVMKEKGVHEGCIEQINRLFSDRLYTADSNILVDSENRIRIDDWEMADDVQNAVTKIMPEVTSENSEQKTDLAGYRHDFLATAGFDIDGVDYEQDISCFNRI